jgi:hypothetical protein
LSVRKNVNITTPNYLQYDSPSVRCVHGFIFARGALFYCSIVDINKRTTTPFLPCVKLRFYEEYLNINNTMEA